MGDNKRPGAERGLLQHVASELGLQKHQARAYKQRAFHIFKLIGLMMATAILVPIAMISLGLLLGPRGYEGLLAAPLSVFACWGVILWWGLRNRTSKKSIARARLGSLPDQMGSLLMRHRRLFPSEAMKSVESILEQLDELSPALQAVRDETPATRRLRKLLVEDLTDLVEHYRMLPARLRLSARHGGETPEAQLVSGLKTIEGELARMHDEMADDDLYSLAAKHRYLELKYGREKGQ